VEVPSFFLKQCYFNHSQKHCGTSFPTTLDYVVVLVLIYEQESGAGKV
jgi:hypothetical protein